MSFSNTTDGEELEERCEPSTQTTNRRMTCLQIAAFIFNNIPV